jgi:hypothetical protein
MLSSICIPSSLETILDEYRPLLKVIAVENGRVASVDADPATGSE